MRRRRTGVYIVLPHISPEAPRMRNKVGRYQYGVQYGVVRMVLGRFSKEQGLQCHCEWRGQLILPAQVVSRPPTLEVLGKGRRKTTLRASPDCRMQWRTQIKPPPKPIEQILRRVGRLPGPDLGRRRIHFFPLSAPSRPGEVTGCLQLPLTYFTTFFFSFLF